jgi:hypothetical protein
MACRGQQRQAGVGGRQGSGVGDSRQGLGAGGGRGSVTVGKCVALIYAVPHIHWY